MNHFLKSVIDWMMEKEEGMAKKCAIPMAELDHQIAKVQEQKDKIQKDYDDTTAELDDMLSRLEKMKNTEILRCQKDQK